MTKNRLGNELTLGLLVNYMPFPKPQEPTYLRVGCGFGLVFNYITSYSVDPSLNPASC